MQLCRISLGEGMWCPIGVDLMFRRRWSMDVSDALEGRGPFVWFSLGIYESV